ncbi:hypothetical protein [Paenibacillus antri]|uniref:hypothetical protein n=1 Tax=Paenibacillus antri TaxID=2582848 RepID=UPI0013053B94|nr:hypothetical protein [Paenibacillus antri]
MEGKERQVVSQPKRTWTRPELQSLEVRETTAEYCEYVWNGHFWQEQCWFES